MHATFDNLVHMRVAETPLSRMLAEQRKPDALDAFRVARRWFMAGRRIEMQELAAELGVNRATLFRWVGGRDDLLGEILWSLAEPTLAAAVEASDGNGAQRITGAIGRFAAAVHQADFLREFVRREPERALRILTTRAGTLQARLVASIETLLKDELPRGNPHSPLPLRDLAYLIVRIVESFLYAEFITGEDPDIAMAELAVGALLGRQDSLGKLGAAANSLGPPEPGTEQPSERHHQE
jgi:AcrR family transcriptional regulator